MTERERVVGFIRELGRRAARREEPFPFGVAHFHDELPRVWSRNYLLAEKNLEGATAPLLAAEANRLLGGAGLAHRKVEVNDEAAGARLEPDFKSLGWDVHCDVLMVARGEPDRPIDTSIVEEVSADEMDGVWRVGITAEPYGGEEVVRQLVANKRVLMGAVDTRFFAARVDGMMASYCDLYSDGTIGQIEAVGTLEEFRNRGLARATVSHALQASREAGNELTFLMALRDDWPKELYRKLGFDEIGRVYEFVRPA
jgi:ribosomal protein S18 acetylase RimI-like enzyme